MTENTLGIRAHKEKRMKRNGKDRVRSQTANFGNSWLARLKVHSFLLTTRWNTTTITVFQ